MSPDRDRDLGLDEDALATCVGCGLCLPHCPTYRVTGEEARSPRGRIRLMREVQIGGAAPDQTFVEAMETCVQCRGCETACPSAVPFGRLMEGTRQALATDHLTVPRWQRLGYRALGHPGLVRAGVLAARLVPAGRRGGLPAAPIRQPTLAPSGTDVALFTGCVMDALQRDVHLATQRVLEAAGFGVTFVGGCCGALAAHAGLTGTARRQAGGVVRSIEHQLPPGAPIVVDSAGCGAQLKDLAHLLGTDQAASTAARVVDVHELVAEHLDDLPAPPPAAGRPRVAIQDPCHLRHVQRCEGAVRAVLARYVEVVELDDEGLCCGAGGAFSALEPELAAAIRSRKLASIGRADVRVVASANPGCSFHLAGELAAAGVEVRHPMEIVFEAIDPSR